MRTKQFFSTLGVLAVLAAIAGVLTLGTKPAGVLEHSTTSPVLHGTATSTGDFEYMEQAPGYTIDVVYPSSTGLAADADLRARTAMEAGLADTIQVFKNDAAQMLTSEEIARLAEAGREYAFSMTYKAYRGQGTVSYKFDVYQDTGGAHPNGFFKTFVFDSSGRAILLGDLFVSTSTNSRADWINQLSGAASVQVRNELGRRMEQEPGDAFFDEGTAPKEENFQDFIIDGNDLVILFPPYQVAAYAAGTFEARIPFETLKGILKPEYTQ
jgi:hypothetical protein